MSHTVHCNYCSEEIENQDDLVVINDFFKVVAYHNKCYTDDVKKASPFFLGQPINTNIASYSTFMFCFFTFVLILLGIERETWVFIILAVYSGVIRFLSWYKYERNLK